MYLISWLLKVIQMTITQRWRWKVQPHIATYWCMAAVAVCDVTQVKVSLALCPLTKESRIGYLHKNIELNSTIKNNNFTTWKVNMWMPLGGPAKSFFSSKHEKWILSGLWLSGNFFVIQREEKNVDLWKITLKPITYKEWYYFFEYGQQQIKQLDKGTPLPPH